MIWVWGLTILGLVLLMSHVVLLAVTRARVQERLNAEAPSPLIDPEELEEAREGWFSLWLLRAGFRPAVAGPVFLITTGLGLMAGAAIAAALYNSPLIALGMRALEGLPGGYGQVLIPGLVIAPWLGLVVLGGLPWLFVRRTRRARVKAIETDLPLTLELLATLSQAGLAFDDAIQRILEAEPSERPLARELRIYQRDMLGGVPRARALRDVAQRADVGAVHLLTSALIQAEQLGTSLAEVLRRQAEDQRSRRRAEVMVRAEALGVKLVFPLVICFMPGLFVFTLGPAFWQVFQITDRLTRGPQ